MTLTHETIRLTTAQALVKFINKQYVSVDGVETPFVEGIWTVFGHGNVLGLGEALEQDPGHLRVLQGKNEQGMGHAATAFAKQNLRRKIYAITASAGPGSANMLASAATALANNIPLLILPADTFASRQPDPVLQQFEHLHSASITTNDAFKAVSRYWDRVDRPEQLMTALIRAFEVMTNPATAGPATICIPQDTEGEAFDYPVEFFNKRVHYIDRHIASERELDAAVQLIHSSERPVILVGGGAKYSEAGEILKAISEKHNIPLVETHAGKSTVSYDSKNALGGNGVLGTSAANKVVQNADLIIGIGTRYTDFTTSSKTIFDYDKVKFLNINVNRMQAYKFDAVQVIGDAKATLEVLATKMGTYETTYGDEIVRLKEEWNQERDRLHNVEFNRDNFDPEIKDQFNQDIMNQYADALNTEFIQTDAFITINEFADDDAIVVGSAGSLPGDMQRLWNSKVENTFHLEYGYSTMGYEINGAVGVKMAKPDQEVYAMVGDGSFLMGHSELVTALQEDIKVTIMLFDNSGFGCINNLQMDNGNGTFQTEFRDHNNNIMNIDYAKVAEGYGVKSYRANNRQELLEALEDAKKQPGTTLIEMKVLPKTMSDGYGGWWNVGLPEISVNKDVEAASAARKEKLVKAKKY